MNKFINKKITIIFAMLFLTCCGFARPEVKIRIAQYKDSFNFNLSQGGTVIVSGQKINLMPGSYEIKHSIDKPAAVAYHLMGGSARASDKDAFRRVERRLEGFHTYRLAVGDKPLEGYPDNRMIFVGLGRFTDKKEAQLVQKDFSSRNISTWIFTENIKLPVGELELLINNQPLVNTRDRIVIKPRQNIELLRVEFARGFAWHGFENRSYSGKIIVQNGMSNKIDVIEQTCLEDVLVGVVPSEISARAPAAALQAQAVAARGEMLSKIGVRHINEGFDFCAEQHCQVYKGHLSVDEHIRSSIAITEGVIILDIDGFILDAVYFANCGGHTAANDKIWTSNPVVHLQGVSDLKEQRLFDLTDENQAESFIKNPPKTWCSVKGVEGSNRFRWKKSFNRKSFDKIRKGLGIGRIRDIIVQERDVSGRIVALRIVGEDRDITILKELPIRQAFGMLNSSFFVADWQRCSEGFIVSGNFDGAGWGHGVGMCQTGAQSRALAGQSYKEILLHYYPKVQLIRLY